MTRLVAGLLVCLAWPAAVAAQTPRVVADAGAVWIGGGRAGSVDATYTRADGTAYPLFTMSRRQSGGAGVGGHLLVRLTSRVWLEASGSVTAPTLRVELTRDGEAADAAGTFRDDAERHADHAGAFEVDNSHPGGDPRTIGYWKNWNRCTSGNQAAVAERNGGAAEGFFLVATTVDLTDHDVLDAQFTLARLRRDVGTGSFLGLLAAGITAETNYLLYALLIIVALSAVTVVQRIVFVRTALATSRRRACASESSIHCP